MAKSLQRRPTLPRMGFAASPKRTGSVSQPRVLLHVVGSSIGRLLARSAQQPVKVVADTPWPTSGRRFLRRTSNDRTTRDTTDGSVTTARFDVDEAAAEVAKQVLVRTKVGIFIVAYQAERFIESVLDRIPAGLGDLFAEITVIDDSSNDATFDLARAAGARLGLKNLLVLRTPFNRGYGGNQKLGYLHAIKRGLDYVILLHGDGQYAPEYLPQIVEALGDGTTDAVIASRMINRLDALRGRMPLYKWFGNQVLTGIENRMLGSDLSEFHSGYRAYKVEALRSIPFQLNSNDFHFDTELLIQLIRTRRRIVEIPVPTFYGDEISHVNGIRYAFNCVMAVAKVRLAEVGLYYEAKFDFGVFEETGYRVKRAENTLHQHVLSQPWDRNWVVADLGANRGILSAKIAPRVAHITAVDLERPDEAGDAESVALDLDGDFDILLGRRRYDAVLALDLIEHLNEPEAGVRKIASILKPGGLLYASTGNIAYFALRISLLAGQFNYGKRGILDLTHKRLFTTYSFEKLLADSGFVVREIRGFGPPIRDMVGESSALQVADKASALFARRWARLFAFNFLIVAQKDEDLDDIYERTAASASRPDGLFPQQSELSAE
jgi:glycosyltransferase involved in cell wall biosynthesis